MDLTQARACSGAGALSFDATAPTGVSAGLLEALFVVSSEGDAHA